MAPIERGSFGTSDLSKLFYIAEDGDCFKTFDLSPSVEVSRKSCSKMAPIERVTCPNYFISRRMQITPERLTSCHLFLECIVKKWHQLNEWLVQIILYRRGCRLLRRFDLSRSIEQFSERPVQKWHQLYVHRSLGDFPRERSIANKGCL